MENPIRSDQNLLTKASSGRCSFKSDFPEKGKLAERRGRKAMGLRRFLARIAKLPEEILPVSDA